MDADSTLASTLARLLCEPSDAVVLRVESAHVNAGIGHLLNYLVSPQPSTTATATTMKSATHSISGLSI